MKRALDLLTLALAAGTQLASCEPPCGGGRAEPLPPSTTPPESGRYAMQRYEQRSSIDTSLRLTDADAMLTYDRLYLEYARDDGARFRVVYRVTRRGTEERYH